MKINFIIADDHPMVVVGIKHELSSIHTLRNAGVARNSTEVLDLLARCHCDVLITDYVMPGGEFGDGMAMLSFIRRRYPELKIVVLTAIENLAVVAEMRKIGVHSVLNKADEVGHLVSAVHAVYAGASYFSPRLRGEGGGGGDGQARALSPREAEVVRLYVSGASISEIARQLNRTKQTVSSQKSSAMRKLGIERDVDLFCFAYETGLVIARQPIEGAVPAFPRPPLAR
ncbi:response regulator transcription factor [Achromobacter veterisilvae]|jgi:two-component system capsular synthesis response regulator RcsB|uniref:Response regulator transcription factor n=1 Tax=Achromobacter veterisilvae TaxID=2069367 RepID=A0ABZ2S3K6_9BURK